MTQLINSECIEAMKSIPDASVDAIITDPPYGTTACKWDSVINFELETHERFFITFDNYEISQ